MSHLMCSIRFISLFLASEYYRQDSQNAPRRQLCFTWDNKNDSQALSSEPPACGIKQRLQVNMGKTRYCMLSQAAQATMVEWSSNVTRKPFIWTRSVSHHEHGLPVRSTLKSVLTPSCLLLFSPWHTRNSQPDSHVRLWIFNTVV